MLNDLFEKQPDCEIDVVIGVIALQDRTSTSGCLSGRTLSVR